MGVGRFTDHGAALIVFLSILALQFEPLLVELTCEVGLCCPPRLVDGPFTVVQEFGLKQATGVHLAHEVVQLVVISDRDPMVFTLDLAPVQLARKGCDLRFVSVTPRREEVGLYGQLLLGGNGMPHSELHDHFLWYVFVPDVIFLQLLDLLRVNGRTDGFHRH